MFSNKGECFKTCEISRVNTRDDRSVPPAPGRHMNQAGSPDVSLRAGLLLKSLSAWMNDLPPENCVKAPLTRGLF